MNQRPGLEEELRDALDRVSWQGLRGDDGVTGAGTTTDLDVDGYWQHGRRRRTRKRAGALALAAVATTTVGIVAWSSGLMGGSRGPDTNVAAVIPAGMTTFVFAAPDAPDADPATISAMTVPDPAELRGTSWTLEPKLWDGGVAADVVGADPARTTLSFREGSWGLEIDGCGEAWLPEGLTLADSGIFPPGDPGTDDKECPQTAQAAQDAEDFWIEALADGGRFHELGNGGWLLLSVEAPVPDAVAPTGPELTTDAVVKTEEPGTAAPSTDPAAPTTDPPAPTGGPDTTAPPDTPADPGTPDSPGEGDLPAFAQPGAQLAYPDLSTWFLLDQARTVEVTRVRLGSHDGYDRVVLDLTGTGQPSWMVRYEDPDALGWGQGFATTDFPGEGVLAIDLVAVPYPEDPSAPWGIPTDPVDGLSVITGVEVPGPFEGHLNVFLGLDRERPYRVLYLEDPSRLVIDIQH